jgi:hypothetical protein
MTKMLSIDGRRIPFPKRCVLCKKRRTKQFITLFGDGRIHAPLCLECLFPGNLNISMDAEMDLARRKCEKIFLEIFAKEWL